MLRSIKLAVENRRIARNTLHAPIGIGLDGEHAVSATSWIGIRQIDIEKQVGSQLPHTYRSRDDTARSILNVNRNERIEQVARVVDLRVERIGRDIGCAGIGISAGTPHNGIGSVNFRKEDLTTAREGRYRNGLGVGTRLTKDKLQRSHLDRKFGFVELVHEDLLAEFAGFDPEPSVAGILLGSIWVTFDRNCLHGIGRAFLGVHLYPFAFLRHFGRPPRSMIRKDFYQLRVECPLLVERHLAFVDGQLILTVERILVHIVLLPSENLGFQIDWLRIKSLLLGVVTRPLDRSDIQAIAMIA